MKKGKNKLNNMLSRGVKDLPDDACLRDVVASKELEVLRQIDPMGGSALSREECVDMAVQFLETCPEALGFVLCGFVKRHYKILVEAMTKGESVFTAGSQQELELFEGILYMQVKPLGRKQYRVVAPRELREVWRECCMKCGMLYAHWTEVYECASAAARLYGSITLGDFIALLDKYGVHEESPVQLVAHILDVRTLGEFSGYVIAGNELRWYDFAPDIYSECDDDDDDEGNFVYSDFLRFRHDVPRCETLTKDEFLAYSDIWHVDEVESVSKLRTFIAKKYKGEGSVEDVMCNIIDQLVSAYRPGEIVAGLSEDYFPDKYMYSEKLAKMIGEMQGNIRLPIYNGHTYKELQSLA